MAQDSPQRVDPEWKLWHKTEVTGLYDDLEEAFRDLLEIFETDDDSGFRSG